MSRLQRSKILVIGELNVDIVVSGLRSAPVLGAEMLAKNCELSLGGASAIFAAGIARLGCEVTFVSQVGRDYFGDFCLQKLEQLGVSLKHVARKTDEKTGITIALSATRDRALVTYSGAVATLTSDHVSEAFIKQHDHLHLTSYYLQDALRSSFPDLLLRAKRLGLTTSFDPNSDPSDKWNRDIDSVLKYTDILFVNEREAMKLTRSSTPRAALKTLAAKVDCAVIKRGRRGAIATRNAEVCADSGFKVRVVDTTGAGDSFAAGFVAAYLREAPLAKCLRVGNACGALSAMHLGGTAGQPTQPQLLEFLGSDLGADRAKQHQ